MLNNNPNKKYRTYKKLFIKKKIKLIIKIKNYKNYYKCVNKKQRLLDNEKKVPQEKVP